MSFYKDKRLGPELPDNPKCYVLGCDMSREGWESFNIDDIMWIKCRKCGCVFERSYLFRGHKLSAGGR